MAGEATIARLRQFLGGLQPPARALLAGGLERALMRGDRVAGAAFILEELRRGLREYGWEGGDRRFGVWLAHEGLGLSGKLDLLLEREGEGAVVDFKLTSGEVGENHRMQLAGYAVLVESILGLSVPTTFLFRIPDNKVIAVPVTDELRQRVSKGVTAICNMRESQELPEPTPVRARCVECEYANYCGDVW